MALALSVGAVLWFDLRLLGLTMRDDRVSDVFHQVRPWMLFGFAVMFVTGVLLFAARATDAYREPLLPHQARAAGARRRQHRDVSHHHRPASRRVGYRRPAASAGAAGRRRVAGAVVRHHRRGPDHGLQPVRHAGGVHREPRNGGRSMKRLVPALALAALVLTLTSHPRVGPGHRQHQRHRPRPERRRAARRHHHGDAHRHRCDAHDRLERIGRLLAAEPAARPLPARGDTAGVQHIHPDRHRPAGEQQPGRQPGARRRRRVRAGASHGGRRAGRHAHRRRGDRRRIAAHRRAAAQRAAGHAAHHAVGRCRADGVVARLRHEHRASGSRWPAATTSASPTRWTARPTATCTTGPGCTCRSPTRCRSSGSRPAPRRRRAGCAPARR